MRKRNIFILLLFTFITSGVINFSLADVEVSKLDGMVDWDRISNYAEAKKIMAIAEDINKEKRRKKQLKDAGVPDDEIRKIIRNERIAKTNGNRIVNNSFSNTSIEQNGIINNDNEHEKENALEQQKNNDITSHYNGNSQDNDLQNVLINDYDVYGKNNRNVEKTQINTSNRSTDDRVIDLSVVPPIPVIKQDHTLIALNDVDGYDNFELTRMLKKAGENVNNPSNFAVFAKEVARIANKPAKQTLSIPDIEEYIDDDEEDIDREYMQASANKKNKKYKYFYKQKSNAENMYGKKSKNFYAVAGTRQNLNKQNNKRNKNKKNMIKNQSKRSKFYANIDEDSYKLIDIDDDIASKKQIMAKNAGAPSPVKRSNENHLRQYQPQNIAQIAYDKNNKHLKPVVFERDLINKVIDDLGSENSVPLARALINKLGKTDIADEDGNTLLMHAVARGNQPLVAMLLSEGASPNALNKEGFAPIHLASSNGDDVAVYSLMMSGGNPNLPDNNGNTPLMYAAKMCDSNSIKMMMALGGDPTIVNNFTGRTAFDFAHENEKEDVAQYMKVTVQKLRGKRNPIQLGNFSS